MQRSVLTLDQFDKFRWDPSDDNRMEIERVIGGAENSDVANQNYSFLEGQIRRFEDEVFPSHKKEYSKKGLLAGIASGGAAEAYQHGAVSFAGPVYGAGIGLAIAYAGTFFCESISKRRNEAYPVYLKLLELQKLAKNKVGLLSENKHYVTDVQAGGIKKRIVQLS